ncbi:PQQ-binding-like beta-propeller repeat protein [Natribaculum luteum]|uniref:PQQ-binding-like beta-propeller repeat protein n=1 Tax=Natribaculum luteum TaxID=1586232 RepID=A0ABD5NZ32_9EURY|nr:PQQ-binding-like beta-propeller repeat protein [Natribaculum luteum]
MKTLAIAAGASATGVTFGSESATAAEGLVDGVVSAITGAASTPGVQYAVDTAAWGVGGVVGLVAVRSLRDSINESPSADQAILHNLCTSEAESLTTHEIVFGNRLKDAPPVANLEGRHGIASAWEDGKSASTAYDRAMQRIRQYYELPEFNHWHVTAKSLLQLGFAAGAAQDTGDDAWIAATGTDGSGNTVQFRFRGTTQEIDLTLHDGTAISNVNPDEADDVLGDLESAVLEVPEVHLRDTTNGTDLETVPVISQDVVDSWDSANETLTYTLSDSTTVTLDSKFSIPNVGSDLSSAVVWNPFETFRLLDEIHSQSDTVTGNYSQAFVEDVYAELDAGNITPQQVRSPEGMTHFLSGTDDPTNARFRVAMLQQLGMEQPDFSLVSEMDVSWSGATGRWVDPDPSISDRHVHPDEFVADTSYTGVLFGSDLPPDGFKSGGSYHVGPVGFLAYENDNEVRAIDLVTQEEQWRYSTGQQIAAVAADSLGETLFIGMADSVAAVDATNGSELWSIDYATGSSSGVEAMTLSPDESTLYVTGYGDTLALSVSDGSTEWSHTPSNYGYSITVTPDGSTVVVGTNTPDVAGIDATDGTELWLNTSSPVSNVYGAAAAPDGSAVYIGDDGVVAALDPSDGSELSTYTGLTDYARVLTTGPDGTVYVSNDNGDYALDPSDWSVVWNTNTADIMPRSISVSSDGSEVYVSNGNAEMYALDTSDGSQKWLFNPLGDVNNTVYHAITRTTDPVDGIAGRALMFDEPSGSEITMATGVLEVVEMRDADGATITHVDDQTIADLEALAGTPDSIETIVSEMDQFDSVDDIKYTTHVYDILEFYGVEATVGESDSDDVTVNDPDYQRPEYDTYDSTEFANYLDELETYLEQLEAEDDTSGTPLFGGGDWFDGGGGLVGLAIIGAVIMAIVGIVTDLLPFGGR